MSRSRLEKEEGGGVVRSGLDYGWMNGLAIQFGDTVVYVRVESDRRPQCQADSVGGFMRVTNLA